jgi:hypothetical protein
MTVRMSTKKDTERGVRALQGGEADIGVARKPEDHQARKERTLMGLCLHPDGVLRRAATT